MLHFSFIFYLRLKCFKPGIYHNRIRVFHDMNGFSLICPGKNNNNLNNKYRKKYGREISSRFLFKSTLANSICFAQFLCQKSVNNPKKSVRTQISVLLLLSEKYARSKQQAIITPSHVSFQVYSAVS